MFLFVKQMTAHKLIEDAEQFYEKGLCSVIVSYGLGIAIGWALRLKFISE